MSTLGVSVVIPCLNESQTIERAVRDALAGIQSTGLQGEVIVADNGSSDGSQDIATRAGARVVAISEKGYGRAVDGGLKAAKFDYLVFADADLSYPFNELKNYVSALDSGAEIVLGNRLNGPIEKGAMPFLNRYLGTPVLSFCIRILYWYPTYDCNSGMRGLRKDAFSRLQLTCPGMEYASEMLVQAAKLRLKYHEFSLPFKKDQRGRPPHLRRWRDGWRHLRFILGSSSSAIMVIPPLFLGFALSAYSATIGIDAWLNPQPGIRYHSALLASIGSLILYLFAISSLFIKVAIDCSRPGTHRLVKFFSELESRGLPILLSLGFFSLFALTGLAMFMSWANSGYLALDAMPLVILASFLSTHAIAFFVVDVYLGILKILPFKKSDDFVP